MVERTGAKAPTVGREQKIQKFGRKALSTLYMLIRNVRMYDPDNDIFVQPFDNLRQSINTIVAVDGTFNLQAADGNVYLNGKQLKVDMQSMENLRNLTEQFREYDVGGFSVDRQVQLEELKTFVWLFSPKGDEDSRAPLKQISVSQYAKIRDVLDNMEENAIEAERKVDRKKYAMTVYARGVYYMRRFVERLQSGGQLPSLSPAARIIRDLVDICHTHRSHFLGMTTTRAVEEYLYYHSMNTALISIVFGAELGLDRAQLHSLGITALFQDIGMAEIDTAIVNKRRNLNESERRVIDLYPLHTVKTLLKGRSLDQATTTRIIASYESKVDYSRPMKNKEGVVEIKLPKVPLGLYGRMVHIAACYDALTSARPFREAYGPEVAMTLMVSQMKYKFDPWLLQVFMRVMAIQPVKVLEGDEQTISVV